MKDTSASVSDLYRRMLMSRSGEERLRMGADMFEAARALVRAGLRDAAAAPEAPHPQSSSRAGAGLSHLATVEARLALLQRTYGREIDRQTLAGVEARLRNPAAPAP